MEEVLEKLRTRQRHMETGTLYSFSEYMPGPGSDNSKGGKGQCTPLIQELRRQRELDLCETIQKQEKIGKAFFYRLLC